MRAIFCGNFEYDARQSELERLFRKYGKVDRVDMKSGFAFIYMEDERDAEDAIRALDRIEFGRKGRRLRVEWTKQERGGGGGGGSAGGGAGSRRSGSSRRSSSTLKPSKTLFVINFDPHQTRTRDLERHFEPYGKIVSVRIRRNFAFVQYEYQEDAIKALEATNTSKLMDRVISVEYAVRDDDDRKDGYGSDRDRRRSPERRRRSPSPYRRERDSPDYGRGGASPYQRERGSPDYGRGASPVAHRRERTSPDYARGRSRSPHHVERSRPDGDRKRSRSRSRSRSPYGERRTSPENGRAPSRSPYRKERDSRDRSRSPYKRGREARDRSRSPYERKSEKIHSDNGRVSSPQSPEEGEKLSPENGHEHLAKSSPEPRDSPRNDGMAESPANGRDHSGSPPQED